MTKYDILFQSRKDWENGGYYKSEVFYEDGDESTIEADSAWEAVEEYCSCLEDRDEGGRSIPFAYERQGDYAVGADVVYWAEEAAADDEGEDEEEDEDE